MKKLILSTVIAVSILGSKGFMAQSRPAKTIAQFPGISLKWVHLAEPEFQRKNLNLDDYRVSVIEGGNTVTVTLASSDPSNGSRGNTGSRPDFEVEISKTNMKVLRSNFVR